MKSIITILLFISINSFAQTISINGAVNVDVNRTYYLSSGVITEYRSFTQPEFSFVIYKFGSTWRISRIDYPALSETIFYTITNADANNPPCSGTWTRQTDNQPENLVLTGNCYAEPSNSVIIQQNFVSIPQLNSAQISTIISPPNGSLVYDINKVNLQMYRNGSWGGLGFTLPFSSNTSIFNVSAIRLFQIKDSSNATAISAESANGIGIEAVSSTGTALKTNGKIQFVGQGAGDAKVLTSDANGNATWQDKQAGLKVGFYAHTIATNTINGNTNFVIPFTVESFDDGNNFNLNTAGTNPNTFVVPFNGVYHFDAKVLWDIKNVLNNNRYKHELRLSVEDSGGLQIYQSSDQNYFTVFEDETNQLSLNLSLNAGDKVSVSVFHTASASRSISTANHKCFFTGYLVYKK